jgi:hypothetical protein
LRSTVFVPAELDAQALLDQEFDRLGVEMPGIISATVEVPTFAILE